MKLHKSFILPLLIVTMLAGFALGQARRRGTISPDSPYSSTGQVPSAREALGDASLFPKWEYEPRFEKDVFTFVRIEYDVDLAHPGHAGNPFTLGPPTQTGSVVDLQL